MAVNNSSGILNNSIFYPNKRESIEAWLKNKIQTLLPQAKVIKTDIPFTRYGLSSAQLLSVAAELGMLTGLHFSATIAFESPSIRSLACHICELANPETATRNTLHTKGSVVGAPACNHDEATAKVAVIGLACRFPGGCDSPEMFWDALAQGKDCIGPIPDNRWKVEDFYAPYPGAPGKMYTREGGFIDDVYGFDASYFSISPREAKEIDPQQRLVLEVTTQALDSAGVNRDLLAGSRTGIFVGISGSDFGRMAYRSLDSLSLYSGTGSAPSIAANRISYWLGLRGPSIAVDTACSSSLVAVHLACRSIAGGECDLAICGGVNAILSPELNIIFSNANLMSPDGRCKAFDAKADGYVRSEGCGMIILKSLKQALADGDDIWGIIAGTALNQDGESNGLTVPNGRAQQELLVSALENAGIAPSQVDYVEAHGTGTAVGDPIEFEALRKVYGNDIFRTRPLMLGSVKTNIGHLEQAAGIAGVIKVLLTMRHGALVPSLHFRTPNPLIELKALPAKVVTETTAIYGEKPHFIAGVSGFSFGGTNAHVIITSPERQQSELTPNFVSIGSESPEQEPQLLLFSANTNNSLKASVLSAAAYLRANPGSPLANISRTTVSGRAHCSHRYRLAVIGHSVEGVIGSLDALLQKRPDMRVLEGVAPQNPLSAGFAFTGQGSQYFGMGKRLYETNAEFRNYLDECAAAFSPYLPVPLLDILFIDSSGSQRIHQTLYTQPAIFSLEHSLGRLWTSWGVEPAVMLGHSIGEYAAACLAGVFSLSDAAKLMAARARLMHELPDTGQMLAVLADETTTSSFLPQDGSAVVAVLNSNRNTVVSGKASEIETLRERLRERDIGAIPIKVSHAFHSPLMYGMLDAFAKTAGAIQYSPPAVPFISTVSGEYAQDNVASAEYWVEHVIRPVRFRDAVATLAKTSVGAMVEIGPAPVLTGMAAEQTSHIAWTPTLQNHADDRERMLEAVGELFILGVVSDCSRLNISGAGKKAYFPGYAFDRKAYLPDWLSSAETDPLHSQPAPPPLTDGDAHSENVEPEQKDVREIAFQLGAILQMEGTIPDNISLIKLGLDSLMALRLRAFIRKRFAVDLTLAEILSAPSLRFLENAVRDVTAENLDESLGVTYAAIHDEGGRYAPFPLSSVQRAYWMGRKPELMLGGIPCQVYAELDIRRLDIDRLEKALNVLVARHDMLHAVIDEDGAQRVLKEYPPCKIAIEDMTGLDNPEVRLLEKRQELSGKILPSDSFPLFSLKASLLPGQRARLHISFDMLIGDGHSFTVLVEELETLYEDPLAQLPELGITFRDYITSLEHVKNSPGYQQSRAYWESRIQTLPGAPELPLAREPELLEQPVFTRKRGFLDAETWQNLKTVANSKGITPSSLLLGAFSRVLGMWSSSQRFCLNLTLFNRLPVHPQINSVVGDFTTLLLLEVDCSSDETFENYCGKVQRQLWNDLEHRDVSAVDILQELRKAGGIGMATMMPVVFTSLLSLTGSGAGFLPRSVDATVAYCISRTPQVYFDHQIYERDGELRYVWDIVESLFPLGMIDDMLATYNTLLHGLARQESSWKAPFVTEDWLSPSQREQILFINNTEALPGSKTLHALFEESVSRTPDAVALQASNASFTYAELNDRANSIAANIAAQWPEPGAVMAVVMEKGWEQIVAVLGILKAGHAFLPLGANQPQERTINILQRAKAVCILTQKRFMDAMRWPEGLPVVAVEKKRPKKIHTTLPHCSPQSLAYVIFTSGSTGSPKGVMQDHASVVNTVLDVNNRFSVTSKDVIFGVSNLDFDLSVYDIFGIFAAGGTLVLPDADKRREPEHWMQLLQKFGVTIWNSVPALLQMLSVYTADVLAPEAKIRLVMLSGDWLPVELPDKIRDLFPGSRVISLGGATEAAIWSICYDTSSLVPGMKSVPYGKPLAGQKVMVLDELHSIRPTWAVGELYIGGKGLALGYLHDPERTAHQFVHSKLRSERLYKTGDIGRYLPDGNIEFLGRKDFQVKIRGHRVELGEIEHAMKKAENVEDAVVVASESPMGHKVLSAYVIGSTDGLREHLKRLLPEYMIPSFFMAVDAFPLTENGKIDRKALPNPDTRTASHTKPEGDLSLTVSSMLSLWAEVLGNVDIDPDMNFFEAGGDSLLATKIVAGIRNRFGVGISLNNIFNHPTIHALAEIVEAETAHCPMAEDELPVLQLDPDKRFAPFPLTSIQHAYWMGRRTSFELGNVSAHFYYEIDSPAHDLETLNKAWNTVVTRHDSLRSIVLETGMQQVLENTGEYRFTVYNLSEASADEEEGHLETIRKEMSGQMLDPTVWPLFDIRVTVLPRNHMRIHIDIDNIIADAWSLFTLLREWADIYHDSSLELPPLDCTFRDYVLAEQQIKNTEKYKADEAYWLERLPSLPPAPVLPFAKDPSTITQPVFIRQSHRMNVDEWQALQQKAAAYHITPASILIAAYAETLALWSRNPHFSINTTLFNRLPLHAQIDSIVGDFTSLNILEAAPSVNEPFHAKASRLQEQLWEDLDHRLYGGVEVMRHLARERGLGGRAIMPVVFTSALMGTMGQDASALTRLGDMTFSIFQTPQVWLDHQVYEHKGDLVLNWDSVDGLFPEKLMLNIFSTYIAFLGSLALENQAWLGAGPSMPLSQQQELDAVNDTAHAFPPLTLLDLFKRGSEIYPDCPAVIASAKTLSYSQLEEESAMLANQLASCGVQAGDVVLVCLKKGWEQIVAVLGILKAGGVYLPLVPPFPEERALKILKNSGAAAVLTEPGNMEFSFPNLIILDMHNLGGGKKTTARPSESYELSAAKPDDLAYIIYTSGSTGEPKGVAISHAGAVNTILDINTRFGVGCSDRVIGLSSLGFDLSVYDIFGTLYAGAALVLPDAERGNDPAAWLAAVRDNGVTIWNSAPSLMQMFMTHLEGVNVHFPESLRLVLLSGDWIPKEMAAKIRSAAPAVQLASLGGATEASIWSVFHEIKDIDHSMPSIPYGRPLANQSLYVLDAQMRPCPAWVTGDLYIGGKGLAIGYYNDPEKTKDSFIMHPQSGERLYKTGDLARFRPEGFFEFLGREDEQVKIRGHRVELGEIESALMSCAGVEQAAAKIAGTGKLSAYIVPRRDAQPDKNEVFASLRKLLPRHMIPDSLTILAAMPLTQNGKVDRKALPDDYFEQKGIGAEATPKATSYTDMLLGAFSVELQSNGIDRESNFFDLGASSFHLVNIQNRIREAFDTEIPIIDFFLYPTIQELAAYLEEEVK